MVSSDVAEARLTALGFTGVALHCAMLLLQNVERVATMDYGKLVFHVGSNQVVAGIEIPGGKRARVREK